MRLYRRVRILVPRIQQLKAEHPFWGYRRIWAYPRFVEQGPVNKQRILRLMREHQLLVQPHRRLKAKRTPTGSNPRPMKPNEWWGIVMTKVMVTGFGWIDIVVVLDRYTKKIVGYWVGVPCTAQQWLAALNMAVHQQFPEGARGEGLSLMSDHGCQPTSLAFMEACRTLEIHQAFTRDNNPQGNADTARVIRPLKEEYLWLQEWTCPFALASALETQIDDDNENDLHSALGYKPPRQFERGHYASHSPPCVAA
jgi:putative transposase